MNFYSRHIFPGQKKYLCKDLKLNISLNKQVFNIVSLHHSPRMCCSRKYPYPSHGRFFKFNPHPSRNSLLVSYFHLKNLAFETPLPLGISINLPWGGYGYFLELHNLLQIVVSYDMPHEQFPQWDMGWKKNCQWSELRGRSWEEYISLQPPIKDFPLSFYPIPCYMQPVLWVGKGVFHNIVCCNVSGTSWYFVPE